MAALTEHTLVVPRTARYVTVGGGGDVAEVWLACHGYGQLAARWARHFAPLASPRRLVVVPEGLSRFYLDGASGRYERVGASWMTREAREAEIADQVRFLDDALVAACVAAGADPQAVRLVGFGFSQGTATVCRWLERSPLAARRDAAAEARASRLVLWGGALPADLDLSAARPWLSAADLVLVAGDRDAIATPGRVVAQEKRLREAGVPYRLVGFSGGHRLNARVLAELAGDTSTA